MPKGLQGPVGKFIRFSIMVESQNCFCFKLQITQNIAHVHGKDTQSSPVSQPIIGLLNSTDCLFLFLLIPLILYHEALHLMGCVLSRGDMVVTRFHRTSYAYRCGLFLSQIDQLRKKLDVFGVRTGVFY